MKVITSATFSLLMLVCSQSFAAQSPVPENSDHCSSAQITPVHRKSPFDFNHMGTGSDKSDVLGVPYYHTGDR